MATVATPTARLIGTALRKVLIERERVGKGKPVHDRKADGIRKRERLVGVPNQEGAPTLLIGAVRTDYSDSAMPTIFHRLSVRLNCLLANPSCSLDSRGTAVTGSSSCATASRWMRTPLPTLTAARRPLAT